MRLKPQNYKGISLLAYARAVNAANAAGMAVDAMALPRSGIDTDQNQSCQTGVTLAGSGGSAPKSTRASPGAWKSVPREARKP